jgi:hypothetical protein
LAVRIISGQADQEADAARLVELLRMRSERPSHRTAEDADELAPMHRVPLAGKHALVGKVARRARSARPQPYVFST